MWTEIKIAVPSSLHSSYSYLVQFGNRSCAEAPKLSLGNERLMLEAIWGGESVKTGFLNKSMYRQALIHTTQTSSTEHHTKSVCPTLDPVWSYATILETDSAPRHSKSSSTWHEWRHMTDIWNEKLLGPCTFGRVCNDIHKMDLSLLKPFMSPSKIILAARWWTGH